MILVTRDAKESKKRPYSKSDQVVKVVELATGKELFSHNVKGQNMPITGSGFKFSLNRDGTRIAIAPQRLFPLGIGPMTEPAEVWDVTSKKLLASIPITSITRNCLLDPEGKRLWLVGRGDSQFRDVTAAETEPISTAERTKGYDVVTGNAAGIRGVVFSPDGSRLAMVERRDLSSPEILGIWEVATGKRRASLTVPAHVVSLAFSPDGKRLFGLGQPLIGTLGTSTAIPTQHELRKSVPLATYLWDGADGNELKEVRVTPVNAPISWNNSRSVPSSRLLDVYLVAELACSPDGRLLAVCARDRKLACILDAQSGAELRVVKSLDNIEQAVFSKDSKRLITLGRSGDRTTENQFLCKEWDLDIPEPTKDTLEEKNPFKKGQKKENTDRNITEEVTIRSRDGERQATYLRLYNDMPRADPANLKITIRDCEGKVLHVLDADDKKNSRVGIESVTFSQNGHLIAAWFGRRIKVWELATGKVRQSGMVPRGRPVSPEGQFLCLREEDGVKVLDFDTLTQQFSVGKVSGTWFSPDGRRFMTFHQTWKETDPKAGGPREFVRSYGWNESAPGSIQLWDMASKNRLSSPTSNLTARSFSTDGQAGLEGPESGRYLLIAEEEGTTAIWDTTTLEQRCVLKGEPADFLFLRFSSDGKRLATWNRKTPGWLIWDVGTRQILCGVPGQGPDPRLAEMLKKTGGKGPILTALRSGHEVLGYPSHVHLIAFSPDNNRVATAVNIDGRRSVGVSEVKVWDATTARELLHLKTTAKAPPPLAGTPKWADFWLSFSPDGTRLSLSYRRLGMEDYPRTPYATWDATPREEANR